MLRTGAGLRGQIAAAGQKATSALPMQLVDEDRPEPVPSGARELALFLTPEPGAEIRSDTSRILEENIPLLKAKVTEVRGIYARVDRLEAFVKMVGHHAAFLEARVLQAERDRGAFPQALRRWLGSALLSSFRNKPSAPAPEAFELPTLYRTEDYFPADAPEARRHSPCPHRPL
ncbi:PREDICTED: breast carcinoma-amplified sequence 4 isoform X2 [Chinchilla lanigera]|uniref:breast carcinoma-amplified sequence 4 isoform X2 n=1 Tax=Chinchilla lanigera TaxID=34839 RepID=UPI0006971730|nr:PREDICTED: breast carcinoma-amplified sequence 4 isoform X2 [Chinchilla lanigera]